ncbi:hypothetical protein THASP1DRAFT_27888 [Thamnocephalis sphaerospora]|uniref:Ima1 N-terminal domain-containing protein n=1 Tax=Thamnocephalis sphaerospora TaxID=78915 RepID=A0A4P9XVM7_9FUNG|nr:hypothetical protein THASP1DRAFT_27888 [Thamnocephalis sphaerospora]|eukprot:RKP10336.1 hypothetical protein THASP1DRAFT_27888 [Thamnocephalis sphaerospora]
MFDEHLNPVRGRSKSRRRHGGLSDTEISPNASDEEGIVFCDVCRENQEMVLHLLANYIPSESDPEFEQRNRTVDDYRRQIEERYPPACARCEKEVHGRIAETDYRVKARYFRQALQRSRPAAVERLPRYRWWKALAWLLVAAADWAARYWMLRTCAFGWSATDSICQALLLVLRLVLLALIDGWMASEFGIGMRTLMAILSATLIILAWRFTPTHRASLAIWQRLDAPSSSKVRSSRPSRGLMRAGGMLRRVGYAAGSGSDRTRTPSPSPPSSQKATRTTLLARYASFVSDDDDDMIRSGNTSGTEMADASASHVKPTTYGERHASPEMLMRTLSLDSPRSSRHRRAGGPVAPTSAQSPSFSVDTLDGRPLTGKRRATTMDWSPAPETCLGGYRDPESPTRKRPASSQPGRSRSLRTGAANLFRVPVGLSLRAANAIAAGATSSDADTDPGWRGGDAGRATSSFSVAHDDGLWSQGAAQRGTTRRTTASAMPASGGRDVTGLEDLFQRSIRIDDRSGLQRRIGDWFSGSSHRDKPSQNHEKRNSAWPKRPPASTMRRQPAASSLASTKVHSRQGRSFGARSAAPLTSINVVIRRSLVLVALMARIADWFMQPLPEHLLGGVLLVALFILLRGRWLSRAIMARRHPRHVPWVEMATCWLIGLRLLLLPLAAYAAVAPDAALLTPLHSPSWPTELATANLHINAEMLLPPASAWRAIYSLLVWLLDAGLMMCGVA